MTKPINKKAQVAEFTRENQAFWGVAGSAFMILHLLVFLIKLDIFFGFLAPDDAAHPSRYNHPKP